MLRSGSFRVILSVVVGAGLGAWAAASPRSVPTCPAATSCCEAPAAAAPQERAKKPNILVIMGDDIGWFNPSCYNRGMMGYPTPNIDRIAAEGALFTDWYAQQSCTAGRAAFVTGQSPIRTGLTKVGLPGSPLGLNADDPTVADILKNLGYSTGQFGKNHLGDRNEFLPTVHGFDEFFGYLYHLNAMEEPENVDYPKNPEFLKKYGPRGVLRCKASDKDDSTVDPVHGKVGKQVIEDTGPLTAKRMETVDQEFAEAALDFIDRKTKEGKPWLCYLNPSRMHVWTHLKKESQGKTGFGLYPDGMAELDALVGQMLRKVDDLKLAENTIVLFTTDNGAEVMSWPDGGTTPFRGEKATNWEGGFRVPMAIRWPGVIKPGSVVNEVAAHEDLLPTFAAAAGEPDLVQKVKQGYRAGDRTYKVHLDGNNLIPFFKGEVKESPRKEFVYWSDDGQLVALRINQWKIVFLEQRAKGFGVWTEPFSTLRFPKTFNLRADPFERGDESIFYQKWMADRMFVSVPAQALVAKLMESFKEFPIRQKPSSFTVGDVLDKLQEPSVK